MNNNTFSGICPYTLGHWGWVDDDSNGLLDTVKRRLVGEVYANIYEMGNGGWFLWNNTGHGFSYSQTTPTWSVAGLRSPATADYDMDVFRDYEHRYKVASSIYAGQEVDFVVGDYNHTAESNEHIEVTRYEGASDNYRIQYESGTGVLYPDGVERAGSWGGDSVVRVWDVPLFAGESVSFTLDVTSGTTDFGMSLFRSNGAEYFAGRASAQWTRNAAGDGGTETWTYTVPADDVYGLVIFANNHADSDFTIQIGPVPLTLQEETPIASSLGSAALQLRSERGVLVVHRQSSGRGRQHHGASLQRFDVPDVSWRRRTTTTAHRRTTSTSSPWTTTTPTERWTIRGSSPTSARASTAPSGSTMRTLSRESCRSRRGSPGTWARCGTHS